MFAIQRLVYGFPEPAPHKRSKPLEVLCLGLPRTGTESLSVALRKLGYPTYHGWDLVFEEDGRKLQYCCELIRRKYNGARDGDVKITSAEFDMIIGDNEALIDSLPAFFTPELLAAYPDAKVIVNKRLDVDAWYRSVDKTIVEIDRSWSYWLMHWFSAEFHWLLQLYLNDGYPGLFHGVNTTDSIQRNAKWVYRDHYNMIRGMLPESSYLEWSVEDGWEPLCKFLDKPVPDEPFPRTNDPLTYADRANVLAKRRYLRCLRNVTLTALTLGGITTGVVMWWQGRIPEVTRQSDLLKRFTKLT